MTGDVLSVSLIIDAFVCSLDQLLVALSGSSFSLSLSIVIYLPGCILEYLVQVLQNHTD